MSNGTFDFETLSELKNNMCKYIEQNEIYAGIGDLDPRVRVRVTTDNMDKMIAIAELKRMINPKATRTRIELYRETDDFGYHLFVTLRLK